MFEYLLFWIFAAILVGAAACVIVARNPVHSALFLVLAFFTAAALWMLLRAEFLAIALVLVYVGAVMVLFLFVVMMLDVNLERLREGFWTYLPLGLVVGALMVAEMAIVLGGKYFNLQAFPGPKDPGPGYSNTKELGRVLYTDYAYPLELAAVLLLVAIIVAIALTLRKRKDTKYQDPARQVAVKRSDRVRLVSMPSEKKQD
ncbi:MAG TPA: NADH-quinone oxidoreductase subunit J [Burkholderiales bacterium]